MYSTPNQSGGSGKRPHDAPTLTVEVITPAGPIREEMCCALCGARPDGHEADGTPRYTGGFIYASIDKTEMVASCRCIFGQAFHNRTKAAYFDELPPLAKVDKPLPIVVFKGADDEGVLHGSVGGIITDENVRRQYFPASWERFGENSAHRSGFVSENHHIDYNERAEARREEWEDE